MVPCKTSMIKLHISKIRSNVTRSQLFFRARARLVILTDEIKHRRMRDGYYVRELYPGAYKCSNLLYIAVNAQWSIVVRRYTSRGFRLCARRIYRDRGNSSCIRSWQEHRQE